MGGGSLLGLARLCWPTYVGRSFGGHFGVSGLPGQYLDLVKIQFLASASVSKSPM